MFQTKVVQKIKTQCMFNNFSPKIVSLRDNVEKYDTVGQAIDNNIIRCTRFACWITKTIHTLRICNTYCS